MPVLYCANKTMPNLIMPREFMPKCASAKMNFCQMAPLPLFRTFKSEMKQDVSKRDPLPAKIIYLENLMLETTNCAMKMVV